MLSYIRARLQMRIEGRFDSSRWCNEPASPPTCLPAQVLWRSGAWGRATSRRDWFTLASLATVRLGPWVRELVALHVLPSPQPLELGYLSNYAELLASTVFFGTMQGRCQGTRRCARASEASGDGLNVSTVTTVLQLQGRCIGASHLGPPPRNCCIPHRRPPLSRRFVNGYPDRAPVRPNISLGDTLAGLHAAFGIAMSLLHQSRLKNAGAIDAPGQVTQWLSAMGCVGAITTLCGAFWVCFVFLCESK